MPYLRIRLNQEIPADESVHLLQRTSSKLATLLGKPERYVMTEIQGDACLMFGGSTEPALRIWS